MGEMSYFLGMEIHQDQQGIFICQRKYANEILNKFGMENCKPVNTPLAQNEKLIKENGANKADGSIYRSLVGCLLYLTTTRPDIIELGIRFKKNESSRLVGFTDSDWAGSHKDMKSTSGYKQGTVAQSIAEAEYIAAAAAVNQAIWLRENSDGFESKAR
ncbi:uncharacterized protein LOC111293435 [Durio zibethinus]|uniref:Uncharacterized protein LOC111293435 n=1 Tax=Durio zibethinus TaxID=66656 RepID=A0A6P5YN00_DURZI|nr:uncharacterized protein LOC111293435 [Durio zibethinus]